MSINLKYRSHLRLGIALALWLYLFLVLVGPFDTTDLSLNIRITLMMGYSLVSLLCYTMLIPIQNKLYAYKGNWKLNYELMIVVLFCLLCWPLSFAYYKSEFVNGTFDFQYFTTTIFLPTICILTPIIFIGRHLISREEIKSNIVKGEIEKVILVGENKHDILKLSLAELVAIKAANNYIEVYYLIDGKIQKKLLRNSLSKIHQEVPELKQVHRSYLVNLQHFVEWKDGSSILLTQFIVPVSKKFKSSLLLSASLIPNKGDSTTIA